jgi:hypothetical protein
LSVRMIKTNSMSVLLVLIVAMMIILLCMITVMSFKADFDGERPRRRHIGASADSLGEIRERFVWYERSYAIDQALSTKVGIVSMVTCSPGFDFWLKHHLDYLKIDLVVLRVEDCPSHKALLEPYSSKVHATFHSRDEIDVGDNYHSMMSRQNDTVTRGLQIAAQQNVSFLFHIDGDELLYVGPSKNIRVEVSNVTGPDISGLERSMLLRKHLMDIEEEYSSIHLSNYEAVYPVFNENDGAHCFHPQAKYLECAFMGKCNTYSNGKSAARVRGQGFEFESKGVRFFGPHNFSGRKFSMPISRMAVLHFDSCTFSQYKQKFALLANASEERVKKIPFDFYKRSIWLLQECKEKRREVGELMKEDTVNGTTCEDKQRSLYKRYKVRRWRSRRAQTLHFM